jgi:hypothetical protein
MYASIRRYKYETGTAAEVNRFVKEALVPRIKELAGFLAYYAIETEEGVWASISVFETQEGMEKSNALAAEFLIDNMDIPRHLSPLEITAGPVVAHQINY